MAEEVLVSISLIIAVAAVLTVLARIIRQPPIIAYLFAGIIVGPVALNLISPNGSSSELISVFAHIGVAFLLFIVGLSLDFRVLKEIGKVSTTVGLAEIILTSAIGFIIAIGLGFSNISALYLGAIFAFSSTVVVVKILSDKREIDTLHGRIALGILIVEDFVAALALMIVPLIQSKSSFYLMFGKFLGALVLIAVIFLISSFALKRILDYLARNQEALFLFGIAWALVLASIFSSLGFSLEIGALIAGMSLASSKYTLELGGKMKPLRDFFVVLFFVFFGSQLTPEINIPLIKNAIIFSLFVFLGKPIIIMGLLRTFGYKKRTNFLAGSSLAQISEFSLILALLGFNLGHLSQEVMNLAILISLITIGLSSYSIYYSRWIFSKISRALFIFEGKKHRNLIDKVKTFDVVLFGYHRIGYKILKELKKLGLSFVVIDYNPKVILALSKEGINCIYGDAEDKGFLSEIGLEKAKLIISTIPEDPVNKSILEYLNRTNADSVFIATVEYAKGALDLYKEGADYVIVPHHLGGEYASKMIAKFKTNKKEYDKIRKKHMSELKKGKEKSNYN
ncbi:MAG: cation:proton antiporter [Nanoarchaeota archaeon]|nr:cation:proton antiporter [Nanoarchaeota archaeon]